MSFNSGRRGTGKFSFNDLNMKCKVENGTRLYERARPIPILNKRTWASNKNKFGKSPFDRQLYRPVPMEGL